MAIKKSELYSSLWKSCDQLRGGMDASQYKDYILVLLFIKYVSDKAAQDSEADILVPEGSSFSDMVSQKHDKDIGDIINKKILAPIAKENGLSGIIDVVDFNDSNKLGSDKEKRDKLKKLIGIFENPALDFGKNRAEDDDILGDAYEYLMRNFATQSGKSKGQFYTPSEVSRVMASIIGIEKVKRQDKTIYDPTCGSGSLLLKAADVSERGLTIYGQEMDNSTAALAQMNMILHGFADAIIEKGNTLAEPKFKQKEDKTQLIRFDYIVANPPFSTKSWSSGFDPDNDLFGRFHYGTPPDKNGDYAFLLHIIRSLKGNGKGAIILPHGVLFRGNVEYKIRKNILNDGLIKGIIGLPANLFYGTGIPACIIIIDKENAQSRRGLFMIDAGKDFVKDGNKNRLREQDIRKIVDTFNGLIEEKGYSRMVTFDEILENDFNLNMPRYIDNQEKEDKQDVRGHLEGGIPNQDIEDLERYWAVYPNLKSTLFAPHQRPNYSIPKVESTAIKSTIFEHPEFIAFSKRMTGVFEDWKADNRPLMEDFDKDSKPKEFINQLSDDVLKKYTDLKLIDKYDIYQYLMSYWMETMQDDAYLIAADGWQSSSDLIPADLIIDRYFQTEQATINTLEAEKENQVQALSDLIEEHSGEDGILEALKNDKGNLSKSDVSKKQKALKKANDEAEEYDVLTQYLDWYNKIAKSKKAIKKATEDLTKKVTAKYDTLTEAEVKTLVIDDKWLTTLQHTLQSEMERISQRLTQRLTTIVERYAEPLPTITQKVNQLETEVLEQLALLLD